MAVYFLAELGELEIVDAETATKLERLVRSRPTMSPSRKSMAGGRAVIGDCSFPQHPQARSSYPVSGHRRVPSAGFLEDPLRLADVGAAGSLAEVVFRA